MLHPRLTGAIGRLRGKIVRVAIVRGLCWGLGALGVLGLALVALDRFVVVPRPPLVVDGLLVGLALAAACALAVRRARQADGALAQWLDVENRLDDRLASALEFAAASDDPWKARVVAETVALLEQRAIVVPRVAVGHVERPLALFVAFAALVGALQLGRRPVRELDAKARVQLTAPAALAEKDRVSALASQAQALADPQAAAVARALDAAIAAGAGGNERKEELLARLGEVRRQLEGAAAAAGPGLGASGEGLPPDSLVRGVANDIKAGDLSSGAQSLARAAEALGRGDLSSDEARTLGELTRHLEQLATRGQSPIASGLAEANAALARGDLTDAARALSEAAPKLPELARSLQREQLYDGLESALRQVEKSTRSSVVDTPGAPLQPDTSPDTVAGTNDPSKPNGPLARSDKQIDPTAQGGEVAYQGTKGKGSFSVGHDQRQAPSEQTATGQDLAVVGQWSGKTIRELLSGAAVGSAAPVLSDVVGAHERVAETRLDREDVPEDYRLAVRNYFEAIRVAGEGAWK